MRPDAGNHSHQRLPNDELDYAARSRRTGGRSEPLHLHWSVRLYFVIAALAVSFYLNKALTESPPVILATELGEHLDACISQILHTINILQSSYIDVFLPPTFSQELEDLEHDMKIAVYSKHQPELDTTYLLYSIVAANEECIHIDASFNEYKIDYYHDLQTLFCVYTQDTINKFYQFLSIANPPVSKPFFSSYERAALLKAEIWSYATSDLSTEVNATVAYLTAIGTDPLTSVLRRIIILANHLSNATAPAPQPHPSIGIRTLLGLSSELSPSSDVNLTAALEIVSDIAREMTHLLYSIETALTRLTKLQCVVAAGPWANTHVVTVEQWVAQDKEMRAWMLEVRDCITDMGVSSWQQFEWEYFWYFDQR
ncbi:MAG: hypothetical protein LQ347_003043 [Umbilicaria vellea]|nr:MAG: hypothetical protein LQ347_003043 [Umbilicaria vellea]